MIRKICIVTGTRAEWGLLSSLARLIQEDKDVQLQIVATNMHLIERYGMTCREIEDAGFEIDFRVNMETEGDAAGDTVRSMALAMAGFSDAYQRLQPDLVVVLGDRYEILVAVSAALIFKIPVAHLHGGEITEGAYDDAIRHAITKMSHLHFASTEKYRQRIIQMGEHPDCVFNVGAIGVDNICQLPLMSLEETQESLGGFALDRRTILVTYHPVTLGVEDPETQITNLLQALDAVKNVRVIFTQPNSDTGNQIIARNIEQWCLRNSDRAICFNSLGMKRYLSVLKYIGAVVGNSSSGIIEVPSFGIPTLDIGERQKGRIAAESVQHCSNETAEIAEHLRKIERMVQQKKEYAEVGQSANPYHKAGTAKRIFEIIKKVRLEVTKSFYDISR